MSDDENNGGGDQEIDLTELIGKVLDDRGFTTTRAERLDILDGIEGRILDAFKSSGGSTSSNPPASSGSSFDEEGFFKRVSDLIDTKIPGASSTTTTTTEKSGGWLSRWLGLKA